ncbi:uncharacterized protein LOC127012496 [Drosophila biarmipes]|uniref:uncharacterized protein LOC127012496 n=1 Tax=Drosophila biarmipes TaxID=125945 RepID=UPI0007E6F282|nr:uncharacterized protein LOC127012496 [Drosophila biarmipes]XP_050746444.1 uncharacterized protein LOC127012496 [Drosophila biarmipes]
MMRTVLQQLLYSTAVLTAITATPFVKVQWQLGREEEAKTTFRYDDLMNTALVALGLSALAMAPYLAIWARWHSTYSKPIYLGVLLPWSYVCCTKFLLGMRIQLSAISYVSNPDELHDLVYALVCYCAIFGMALEQILHWGLLYHLVTKIVRNWRTNFIFLL